MGAAYFHNDDAERHHRRCYAHDDATLKAYFSYVYCGIECGIPRVTLEGEKSDWENILTRLEKLKEYGLQTIAWYHLLFPVISRFVKTFDEPSSPETVKFWQQIAHYEPGGSGPSYYTGWINAFCVFSEKGEWIGHQFLPVSIHNYYSASRA